MSFLGRPGPREALLAVLIAGLTLLGSVLLAHTGAMRTLEAQSLDLRFRLRGAIPPGQQVALIMVDDRSLDALGRWPLSRRLYADAVARLDRMGARVIVFDMLFPEPEEPVAPALKNAAAAALELLPRESDLGLRQTLTQAATDDPDGVFVDAIARSGKTLLPFAFTFAGAAQEPALDLSDAGYARFDPSPIKPAFVLKPVAAVTPIARLGRAAAGLGHVSWIDPDGGLPRYDYLALPFEGDFIPSLPVRAVAAYLGVPWSDVGLALGRGVTIGKIFVPTNSDMGLLVNYLGPKGTVPPYSFAALMSGAIPAAAVQGRVVLLGGSFTGSSDSYPSPFGGKLLPGTERLADTIDTILSRRFIVDASPAWLAGTAAAVLSLSGFAGGIGARLPGRLSPLAGSLAVAVWLGVAQMAFLHGLRLPVVGPVAALFLAMIGAVVFRYGVVERDGRRVRSAFRQYMAPEMVDVLAAHPERLRLGGETRRMTFLFCDIRGFTALSEPFKDDPQGLIQLINAFLTPMTDVIMARRGTIDKYMGDCIMAFWNAPLDDPHHGDRACESALAMLAALADLNKSLAQAANASGRPFSPLAIGIGLNTGPCVVGNMGSARRFDYSVLGDAVNLASRLEGQSKTYGVAIVIGEETRNEAPGWAALELDLLAVKGKREAVRIFALMGDAEVAGSEHFRRLVAQHDEMLAAYRRQDWVAARTMLRACRDLAPAIPVLYDLYASRIDFYESNPPGAAWDGVHFATAK